MAGNVKNKQYDRQVRLWGLDAQQRLGKAKVLMVGLGGLAAEVAKNVVLAGLGQVCILDSTMTTEEDLGANYFLTEEDVGKKTRAQGARPRLNDLNPLCEVVAMDGETQALGEDKVKEFDVVCISGHDATFCRKINAICRKHSIGFFAADSHGLFASFFIDLNSHQYTVETKSGVNDATQKKTTVDHEIAYASMEEAAAADWTRVELPTKRITPLFFAIEAVHEVFDKHGKFPGEGDAEELAAAQRRLCEAHKVAESVFDKDLIKMVAAQGKVDLNAVCSMVGGLIGDSILKSISRKEEPVTNHFVFDGRSGSGMVFRFPAQGPCVGDRKRPRADD